MPLFPDDFGASFKNFMNQIAQTSEVVEIKHLDDAMKEMAFNSGKLSRLIAGFEAKEG